MTYAQALTHSCLSSSNFLVIPYIGQTTSEVLSEKVTSYISKKLFLEGDSSSTDSFVALTPTKEQSEAAKKEDDEHRQKYSSSLEDTITRSAFVTYTVVAFTEGLVYRVTGLAFACLEMLFNSFPFFTQYTDPAVKWFNKHVAYCSHYSLAAHGWSRIYSASINRPVSTKYE